MFLTRFRCFFFWLWLNRSFYFACILFLFTNQFSLVILGQISFWFYCHRLWWGSWHAMLTLFLLCVFLILIFSFCDLFQETRTDASCVLCIICFPLSKSRSNLPIAPGLLHCWRHLRFFYFAFALICFWLNLIVQFTSKFRLSCTDLCKVSTENSDHVISQMIVLIAKIHGNCFKIIFNISLVWHRFD